MLHTATLEVVGERRSRSRGAWGLGGVAWGVGGVAWGVGGVGGARFLQGLLHLLGDSAASEVPAVTVVANTADDIWMHGLKICPDLDTVMYTLGGGIDRERGWGRTDETWSVKEELAAYGVEPTWFGLGDRDLATHLVRTEMLEAGYALSAVTTALCARWRPGVRLLPMTDDRVETHVVVDDADQPSGQRAVHFQEYWVRLGAQVPARAVVPVGLDRATPAPGVLEAIASADLVILPPSNPVVSNPTAGGSFSVSFPGVDVENSVRVTFRGLEAGSAQIEVLRKRVAEAEEAAERFRSSEGLYSGTNNTTLNAQQLNWLLDGYDVFRQPHRMLQLSCVA